MLTQAALALALLLTRLISSVLRWLTKIASKANFKAALVVLIYLLANAQHAGSCSVEPSLATWFPFSELDDAGSAVCHWSECPCDLELAITAQSET